MRRFSRIAGLLLLVTLAAALIHMGLGIASILSSPWTSFPWYAACYVTLLYFGAPVLLEIAFYLWARRRDRKQTGASAPKGD